jgi:integrase
VGFRIHRLAHRNEPTPTEVLLRNDEFVLRRSLHPVLESLKAPKAGLHSFRRFRATHLSKSRVPDDLKKFWMGHAKTNQTEEYVKLFDEVEYRRQVADSIGMGFDLLPEKPIVRNVRKKLVKMEMQKVA